MPETAVPEPAVLETAVPEAAVLVVTVIGPAGRGTGPALAGLGTGWCGGRGRAGAAASADCSAAASCSGRGRDTSLARMAALSVIFIPGIGTLHRYSFQPAVNQSREGA